jgi:ABC-type sugar transport system ATPase subunit
MELTVTQASAPPKQSLLRASGVTRAFGAVQALREINFELARGEVHALLGENGAGKSTFTKIVTGVLTPDSGELWIEGNRIEQFTPDHARSLGVAAIYQQPLLFPHLTVAENIAVSLERGGSGWTVDWSSRYEQAERLTEQLGAKIDPHRLAGSLSMAEQQLIEIAKAVGSNARILFMDEPTALLTEREVNNLFRIVANLRSQGVGIVYISHRLEEIQTVADRVTVLRDGQTIGCRDARSVRREELISLMVGRSVSSIYPKRIVPIRDTVLSVSGLSNPQYGLRDITFSVREGEILGFAGLIGSGRTELAKTLFGLSPNDSPVTICGRQQRIDSVKKAIELGLGYLPEDRRQHGLITEMSVAQNISMADMKNVSRRGMLDYVKENTLAEAFVSKLSIKTSSVQSSCSLLSGGNQQKVALARWMAIHPRIMILDEPTQGVDVGSKAEIHQMITAMAESGVAIILISSELPEIVGMCDRVAVFHDKTIAAILTRSEATQENIMTLAFGHQLQRL